nr:Putative amidase domain protein [uncultured bacterium]
MSKKIRIGLVYGGRSGEHDVSLQTALAVMKAIDYSKYEIKPVYITQQGDWRHGPSGVERLQSKEQLTLGESADARISAVDPISARALSKTGVTGLSEEHAVDVVFPLLHGTYGEDGTIQGLLEMAGIPYVGAGVLASAVGMDKVMMKKIFAHEGLPQCMFRHFTKSHWKQEQTFHVMEIEVSLGYPCFVKPANLGSSVGISKVHNRQELLEAIEYAFRFDRKVIVEESIDAREIEVGVLGNDRPITSVPGEVVSNHEFYDYKAKYIDGNSAMLIPADLEEDVKLKLQEMAIRAFQAIDAAGLSRVDFFIKRGDGQILINEINTMPGFTPFSMYPLLWRESGKTYPELLNELIMLALERHKGKEDIQYTF